MARSRSAVSLFLANNKYLDPGEIPVGFRYLVNLRELSLRNTNRVGQLPGFLGEIQQDLTFLDVSINDLEGAVPLSWTNLVSLRVLILTGNPGLVGQLEEDFGAWENLETMLIDGTGLFGDLDFMCDAVDLTFPDEGAIVANCQSHQITSCKCCMCCQKDEPMCSGKRMEELYIKWDESVTSMAFHQV